MVSLGCSQVVHVCHALNSVAHSGALIALPAVGLPFEVVLQVMVAFLLVVVASLG